MIGRAKNAQDVRASAHLFVSPMQNIVYADDSDDGGHIGLMAGSKARKEIWPDIAQWLEGTIGEALALQNPPPDEAVRLAMGVAA